MKMQVRVGEVLGWALAAAVHPMLVDLKAPLKQGDRVKATLMFERAGSVAIAFQVQGVGASQPASTGHSDH